MRYDKIRNNAPSVLSLTSLTVVEFEALLPTFKYLLHYFAYHFFQNAGVKINRTVNNSKRPISIAKLKNHFEKVVIAE